MRLDSTTLTREKYTQLIAMLLQLDTLAKNDRRIDLLSRISYLWKHDIPSRDTTRAHVEAIWDQVSSHGEIDDFFGWIGDSEGESPAFQRAGSLIRELRAFVEANAHLYPHLDQFVGLLDKAPREMISKWLNPAVSKIPDLKLGPQISNRDLLLTLGEYQSDSKFFPIFTLIDGIAADLLNGGELASIRQTLDTLASKKNVTPEGIGRLRDETIRAREHLAANRPDAVLQGDEASIVVVIEQDLERPARPHYFFRVYEWKPWESAEVARSMCPRGRVVDPGEAEPAVTLDKLLPSEAPSALALQLGKRIRDSATAATLVEFVVPCALMGEPFDSIPVDLLGNVLGDETCYVPLGKICRVVVRPLERWWPSFLKAQGLVAWWRRRWHAFSNVSFGGVRAWLWRRGIDHNAAIAALRQVQHLDVGCVGLGFMPAADIASVHKVLLVIGAPVALWLRSGLESDAEAIFLRMTNGTPPGDLRDRVMAERAKDADIPAVTLLWDDPERSPIPLP